MKEERVFEYDDKKREMLDADRCEELLKELDRDGPTFHRIDLSGKSIGEPASFVVASHLAKVAAHDSHQLERLCVADIIAGRPEDEALRVLQRIANSLPGVQLREIDVSDNALGAKGISAFAALFTDQDALEHVFFCNNGLAADAGRLITRMLLGDDLADSGTRQTKLKTIHFFNNLLEDRGAIELAPLLAGSPELCDLRFSSLRMRREGSLALAKALSAAKNMRKLEISDSTLGEAAAVELAKALAIMRELEELSLRDVSLGDIGVKYIVHGLRGASKLRVLDVSCNELTKKGAKQLRQLLPMLPALEEFVAEENEFETSGCVVIAEGFVPEVHTSMRKINMKTNQMSDRGAMALAQRAAQLEKLEKLELDGNALSESCCTEIAALLEDRLGSLSENDDERSDGEDDDAGADSSDESEDANEDDINLILERLVIQ
ncbi:RAN GTPase-activating protein 1 [Porphyridium purpureum]|uniref:RAN GTPase-activating protein 1 n=1 Tax=Porphyridium purpureum TaxID=35688 RepID=A0A5J4YSH5_PORPP|nr:RAN GTPase-activating protein 1 [Porphyridium purpureum]|eukprot:POR4693..scf229_5